MTTNMNPINNYSVDKGYRNMLSVVAQDALEVKTTASGNNSYTPSIETVAQIKYKKLPFYEVIDEVIKPTLLTGTDTCTLPNVHKGMKEAIFILPLSLEQINFVASNRKISSGKEEYLYQFQIRICQFIEPVPNESPDYMPLDLFIRVGRKPCLLPPSLLITPLETKSRLTARPIDCTENVKLCPFISNYITINWTPDGKHYVFALYFVKKLTTNTSI
ncbi:E3 SUMO-protein ligase PIAS1-like isoform X1 [Aphis gossypii]|uniref:E3 SUMO-protein ligase PIAS1-like isoform X1 n=3 Tax=Aphis gossypii TaxID=80765 RepID=UPI002158B570|nr:E3 SUMO-protein ligase PIAS1-like isoform X1 [Aphis gossypii]